MIPQLRSVTELAACTLLWLNRPMEAFLASRILCDRAVGRGIYPLFASAAQIGSYSAMKETIGLVGSAHSATAVWGKTILLTALDPKSSRASDSWIEAMSMNSHVPSILGEACIELLESRRMCFSRGTEDEACWMVQFYQPVWSSLQPYLGTAALRRYG